MWGRPGITSGEIPRKFLIPLKAHETIPERMPGETSVGINFKSSLKNLYKDF